jgi:hypothetical protein
MASVPSDIKSGDVCLTVEDVVPHGAKAETKSDELNSRDANAPNLQFRIEEVILSSECLRSLIAVA